MRVQAPHTPRVMKSTGREAPAVYVLAGHAAVAIRAKLSPWGWATWYSMANQSSARTTGRRCHLGRRPPPNASEPVINDLPGLYIPHKSGSSSWLSVRLH